VSCTHLAHAGASIELPLVGEAILRGEVHPGRIASSSRGALVAAAPVQVRICGGATGGLGRSGVTLGCTCRARRGLGHWGLGALRRRRRRRGAGKQQERGEAGFQNAGHGLSLAQQSLQLLRQTSPSPQAAPQSAPAPRRAPRPHALRAAAHIALRTRRCASSSGTRRVMGRSSGVSRPVRPTHLRGSHAQPTRGPGRRSRCTESRASPCRHPDRTPSDCPPDPTAQTDRRRRARRRDYDPWGFDEERPHGFRASGPTTHGSQGETRASRWMIQMACLTCVTAAQKAPAGRELRRQDTAVNIVDSVTVARCY